MCVKRCCGSLPVALVRGELLLGSLGLLLSVVGRFLLQELVYLVKLLPLVEEQVDAIEWRCPAVYVVGLQFAHFLHARHGGSIEIVYVAAVLLKAWILDVAACILLTDDGHIEVGAALVVVGIGEGGVAQQGAVGKPDA